MFPKIVDIELPITIDDAVTMLLDDLPLLDRTRLSSMTPDELDLINRLVGLHIARDFLLWSGNHELLHACLEAARNSGEEADPTLVIIRAMWEKLQQTHVLRLVR
ncbi:hypothetical protein DSCA_04820 [Desulfosarcina alkanivorans]|jgi:hypothetical protein|uniref:Uncharacterized protein n=1 Tax=Desulfosarcina alkanivorans TaxID=571177 RepID=A0A5K7YAX9_9BACT|nr:hypothetical protein [Desulfosarcina alkanivorans]BBO66552.1 hypothetical protein DSCA_04820 [Desulfosarcina alkanivorans]